MATVNVISPGGTIFSMARDGDQNIWIAASAGILRRVDRAWRPLPGAQPLPQVHTLTWAGRTLVAGGTAGQIVYSTDGGSSWYQAHTGGLSQPVTWLHTSPQYHLDKMLWAGTEGGGIFRSRDGGRSWRPVNAGLGDLAIIALATPPLRILGAAGSCLRSDGARPLSFHHRGDAVA